MNKSSLKGVPLATSEEGMEGWRWFQLIEEASDVQRGQYEMASTYLKDYLQEHEKEIIETMTIEQFFLFLMEVL